MTPYLEYGASTDAALLAHEAVHVAADYLQSLGMEDVDEEVMAYTVQAVSEYLIEEHFKWKKRHLDKDWLTAKRTDGWQSGRLRLFAKQVSAQSVSGVQIPHHPPYRESSHLWVAFFMPRFGSSER